jgi:hypothetical protein
MGHFEFAAPGVSGANGSAGDFTVGPVEAFARLIKAAGSTQPSLLWSDFVALRLMGIGKVAERLLLAGYRNEKVLTVLKFIFPEGDTNMACVAWYRNKARKAGLPVKTETELKREAILRGES